MLDMILDELDSSMSLSALSLRRGLMERCGSKIVQLSRFLRVNGNPSRIKNILLDKGSEKFQKWDGILKAKLSRLLAPKDLKVSDKSIFDPQDRAIQFWNRLFVISCILEVSVDPLFLYIPIIRKSCLGIDEGLNASAIAWRMVIDAFYIIRIVFQFRTAYIAPSSSVFGKGELVTDTRKIAKRYLFRYFFVNLVSILPLPRIVVYKYAGFIEGNIKHARKAIEAAAAQGAKLVMLPEIWNSPYSKDSFAVYAEDIDAGGDASPSTVIMSDVSQLLKITILGGSIPERCGDRLYNTCCVFGSDGKLKAKHRKIHLFDIDIPGKITFKESMTLTAGITPTVVDTDVGRIGIGICYDIRFQELAMLYAARAAHLICYPRAFNMPTGPLHWELLQRARATDNQLYFIIHTRSGSYVLTPILKERSAKPPAKPPDNIYNLHVDDMRLVWGFDKTMSHFAEIILRYTNLNGEVGLDEVNIMKFNKMHDMKRVSSLPASFYQGIDILGDKVEKVIVFDCIMHLPCCLIIDAYGWIKNKRIMKAQALTESSLVVYMSNTETTMEINPENSIMEEPRKRSDAKKKDKCAVDWAKLLFDGVLLQSDFSLNHLHTFENNSQCHKMLRLVLTIVVADAREEFDNALIVDWMLHDEVTDSVCLARFANNIFMFSVPRPPEDVDLDREIYLEAKKVEVMSFGQIHVKNKVLHLVRKCNQSTFHCAEVTNLEEKVFRRMEECCVLSTKGVKLYLDITCLVQKLCEHE